MTALQDWLTLRPVDQSIKDIVCRPFRAVLSTPATGTPDAFGVLEFRLQRPGIERC